MNTRLALEEIYLFPASFKSENQSIRMRGITFRKKEKKAASDLDLLLPEVHLAGQLFPGADVGVLGLLEEALQSLQLLIGEDGAVPPLPAAVQLVEELQLGPRQAAHVHVGHHLMWYRGDQHRARAVVGCRDRNT